MPDGLVQNAPAAASTSVVTSAKPGSASASTQMPAGLVPNAPAKSTSSAVVTSDKPTPAAASTQTPKMPAGLVPNAPTPDKKATTAPNADSKYSGLKKIP